MAWIVDLIRRRADLERLDAPLYAALEVVQYWVQEKTGIWVDGSRDRVP